MSEQGDSENATGDTHSNPLSEAAPGIWVRTTAQSALTPGQIVGGGRFALVQFIARGGMGMVWKARDTRLDEDVALKFLPPEVGADSVSLDDLRRETLKSRRLSHPNIVRIHDLFEAPDELPFICMEFIDGTPLNTLKTEQPHRLFVWDDLEPLVRQFCEALEYAHNQRVIHRDLKPGNLLLTRTHVLKLADFGLAATISESMSRVSGKLGSSGTPPYMSPQQMNSCAARVTDDIYSFGATLYELLTSKPPFYTGDIYRQVKETNALPLADRLADLGLSNEIPPAVGAMILACLAKDPEQRPQSARAIAEWIGLEPSPATGIEPVVSPPQSAEHSQSPSGTSQSVDESPEAGSAPPRPRKNGMALAMGAVVLAVLAAVALKFGIGREPGKSLDPSKTATADTPPAIVQTLITNPATPLPSPPTQATMGSSDARFIPIFNGSDLAGWHAQDLNWSVKDEILRVELNGQQWSILDWVGGTLDDFELRLSCRFPLISKPQCLIAIGQRVGDAERQPGYFHVVSPYKYSNGRVDIGNGGNSRLIGPSFNNPDLFNKDGWNEVLISAKGRHITYDLNGSVLFDSEHKDDTQFSPSGGLKLLAWQSEPGHMIAEFKDIRLKRSSKAITSESVQVPSPTGKTDTSVILSEDFENSDAKGLVPEWEYIGEDHTSLRSEGANHFLHIENANPQDAPHLDRFIRVDPRWKSIRCSMRVRGRIDEFGQDWGGFTLYLECSGSVGITGGCGTKANYSTWTRLESEVITLPKGTTTMNVKLAYWRAKGSFDFDDVHIWVDEWRP